MSTQENTSDKSNESGMISILILASLILFLTLFTLCIVVSVCIVDECCYDNNVRRELGEDLRVEHERGDRVLGNIINVQIPEALALA